MENLFYLMCFFPFIKWFSIGGSSDIQPYCMIITCFLLIFYGIKQKIILGRNVVKFYRVIFVGIIIGLIITIITSGFEIFRSVRYLATYISLIIVSCFTYLHCKKNNGFNEKKIKKIINIYFLVGVIQLFQKDFLYMFIANARTSGNRGVISLSSEPSFYGYMCIFFMILVLDFKSQRKVYLINLLIQICFLAKSAVTFLYIIIFIVIMVLYSVRKINFKRLFFILIIIIGVFGVGYYYLKNNSGQRIAFFINTLLVQKDIKNIVSVLMDDYSFLVRFTDIKVCIEEFLKCFGIPQGFDTRKISSGYGSLILSMGWIGVLIIGYIYRFCKSAYKNQLKKILPKFLTIIMFSAIQVSNPVFAFLIGYFMFLSEKKSDKNES